MNQLFIQNPFTEKTQIFGFSNRDDLSIQSIISAISQNISTISKQARDFRFILNGKQVQSNDQLRDNIESHSILRILMRIRGGKGGFGSQMKKEARAQKKITDWSLSRNLSGRRVRDINNEKKLIDFFKKQKNEQEQVDQDMKQFKDMQKEQGTQNFGYQIMNNDYKERTEQVEESVSSSVLMGMKKNKNKSKPQLDQQNEFEQVEEEFKVPKKVKKQDEPSESQTIKEEYTNSDDSSNKSEKQLDKPFDMPFSKSDLKQEEISQQNLEIAEDKKQAIENLIQKQPVLDEKKLIALGEKKEFEDIDMQSLNSMDDLIKLGDGHLKNELTRLGLKAGGRIEEKAQRLWAIKQDPQNLFNPKFMAKKNEKK